jgi:hypothetical protein
MLMLMIKRSGLSASWFSNGKKIFLIRQFYFENKIIEVTKNLSKQILETEINSLKDQLMRLHACL